MAEKRKNKPKAAKARPSKDVSAKEGAAKKGVAKAASQKPGAAKSSGAAKSKTASALSEAAPASAADPLALFHPIVAEWFSAVFDAPTAPQEQGWPAIAKGESTLILAPTGTGKTLTAFLWCLNRLMFEEHTGPGCRVVYISPLKALAVDVERNLRSPLIGIANLAERKGIPFRQPEISLRTGDTSQKERSRFRRKPAEILITTPESLYLLLTSQSAAGLATVDTVIVDEIHAMVPTKRGAHLALTLERLEALVASKNASSEKAKHRIQRIGLSATQRPLEEVARFLGGVDARVEAIGARIAATSKIDSNPALLAADLSVVDTGLAIADTEISGADIANVGHSAPEILYRPVTIVNAGQRKQLNLRVEVPVEDMARLGQVEELPSGPASQGAKRTSIWTAIYPRLLELIRSKYSTLLFVNSRRVAERLAGALNELAEEPLVRAHHGSLAAAQRSEIEELLKAGKIRALVATSSLELGIDMGAIDLVIQIEAPPSVASGLQRIGRAGHQSGAVSEGVLFPKYRADLVACAAVTRAMREGLVEASRYLRNPLDVLAQQMVAIVAQPPSALDSQADDTAGISADELFRIVRSAAPFAGLSRASFEGVLDMLAGRYPSDEFAELRPRITWDRIHNILTPREGAKRLAILNGGTIPDRGTYGVFLNGSGPGSSRVGELDEEMVFESRTGDTFVLGATTWRIQEITRDRVEVVPAPGEPGKMPFWHGDAAGRPLEFGQRIGALVRELREMPRNAAASRLVREHDLAPLAADNLLRFLADQEIATEMVPDDRQIVIERVRDELGDWRVCVLTPFGSRVHAPWAIAVNARLRAAGATEAEVLWGDDGFVLRMPEADAPPDTEMLFLDPAEASELVLRQLGSTALFAARFRESAARALLLPRRRAQGRTPLWQQRKRAYDLLSVASRYPSFPILLETYRECLRDVFDMPAFLETLRAIQSRHIRVHTVETRTPSPFASSLLFSYVANYIYDGDAPLAERRAQALTIDQDQLRELLGDTDLRELLDSAALEQIEEDLQALSATYKARNLDGLHDLLLRLGDLSREEIRLRSVTEEVADQIDRLVRVRRVLPIKLGGAQRFIAIEDAARYRDALGIPLPPGVATAFLTHVQDAPLELVRRYARTHGPFTSAELVARLSMPLAQAEGVLRRLEVEGRVLEGEFRPGGLHREWCDAEVLRQIRRKSLARLRKEIEAVPQSTLSRFATHWQGVLNPRRGLDALLDALELLQGMPMPASLVETEILPARVANFLSSDLDTLIAAGELIWCGTQRLGEHDGRIAFYLTDRLADLWPPESLRPPADPLTEREQRLLEILGQQGASFFAPLHEALGGGYPGESLEALWSLVWRGLVTNDSLHALRAYIHRNASSRTQRRSHTQPVFRSRRAAPPSAEGRWSLVRARLEKEATATEWGHAVTLQLLNRYGVLTREAVLAEDVPGGFSAIYGVLKVLEESGRIRRGYFVEGLGATQFALPAGLDLLRSLRQAPNPQKNEMVLLAATDPANLFGAALRWQPSAAGLTPPVVDQALNESLDPADASAGWTADSSANREVNADAKSPELIAPAAADAKSASTRSLTRSTGSRVVLRNGELLAYLRRGNPNLQVFLPPEEPDRSHAARDLAEFLFEQTQRAYREAVGGRRGSLLISTINGLPAGEDFLSRSLLDAGFQFGPMGFYARRRHSPVAPALAGAAEAGDPAEPETDEPETDEEETDEETDGIAKSDEAEETDAATKGSSRIKIDA